MRVVLDTNVLISAIVFGGTPEKIILKIYSGKLTMVTSAVLLAELANVLRKKIGWNEYQINFVIRNFGKVAEVVNPKKEIRLIKKDISDNRLLECALEGKADYIITGDKKHLLGLEEFEGIPILSPADFLGILYEE